MTSIKSAARFGMSWHREAAVRTNSGNDTKRKGPAASAAASPGEIALLAAPIGTHTPEPSAGWVSGIAAASKGGLARLPAISHKRGAERAGFRPVLSLKWRNA
ncbi:MAG: hypothetical protein Kow0026_01600 [Oricola sp.]